jgi:leukotriene-A4 hydrolase
VHIQLGDARRGRCQARRGQGRWPGRGGPAQGWSTQQWLRFLNGLPRQQTPARLKELDETLGLSASSNAYVRSAWAELAIANRYDPALPSIRAFATSIGRGLLIYPIYKGLMAQGDWGKPIARGTSRSRTTFPISACTIRASPN